jgi:ribonucleotide reductase alpha subunit
MKLDGIIIERIHRTWMRVSIGTHGNDLAGVKETYDLMSQKHFTHVTSTLLNVGTPKPQLPSYI